MTNLITVPDAGLQQQATADIQTLLAKFWMDYRNVKDVTRESYTVCLRCFAAWMQENNIIYPQKTDIYDYVKYLASPHPRRARSDRPGSAPGSVFTMSAGGQVRYLRAVKLFFKWCSQNPAPYYYPNIADGVKGAKCRADNKKRDALTREEALKVLDSISRDSAAGKRDYAMSLLSLTCGLRIIELQRADIGNMEVIAEENVLFIQGKGRDEADEYKKLTPETYSAIMDYLKTRKRTDAHAPLFASVGNRSMEQRLTEPSIARIIKDRLIAAGFNSHRISAHSLRHSSITFLLEAGASLQEAQYHARHASPETTGIYAHNLDKRKAHHEQMIYDFLFDKEQDPTTKAVNYMKRMTAAQQAQILQIMQAMAI